MGSRDKALLKAAGLSYSRAAGILQVTRQTLHERVTGSAGEYLEGERLAQLYVSMRESDKPEDKENARNLAETARTQFSINLEELADQGGVRHVWDYYLIFSPWPLELKDPGYPHYMATQIYTRARVVAYFVGYETALQSLIDEIRQQQTDTTSKTWTAKLFVIKTNLADALPHIALLRDRIGDWEGQVFDLRDSRSSVLLDVYVSRMRRILRSAGFAIEPQHDPATFFPPDMEKLEFRGLTFEKHFAK